MGVDPDDDAAAKVIAQRLSPEKQAWFDNLALRGAHEYAVELENENTALREQLARVEKERLTDDERKVLADYHYYGSEKARERLKQIRERRSRNTGPSFGYVDGLCKDIDFLLSLLDNQAADKEFAVRTPLGIQIANDAATRMRDACVEKVRDALLDHGEMCGDALYCDCGTEVNRRLLIEFLESLPIDRVEQKP